MRYEILLFANIVEDPDIADPETILGAPFALELLDPSP